MSDPQSSHSSPPPARPSSSHSTTEHSGADTVDTSAHSTASGEDQARTSAGVKQQRSRSLLYNWVIPLMLLAVGGAVVLALGTAEPEENPDSDKSRAGRLKSLAPVRVESIRSLAETGQDLQLKVDGTVVPYREVRVATEVAGEIVFKSDKCEAGSSVRKGDLLIRIDPTYYELEVERLTRQKEQAYESLRELDQQMVNTKRLLEVAEQNVKLQQREVDRLEQLPERFASENELDQAEQALLQANQERITQQNQLDLLEKRRANLEAAERLAATQLRTAKVDLERTEIEAPIDGVIVSEDAELNSFVNRGNSIVTMEDTSRVEIATKLRMDQLYWVLNQTGQELRTERTSYDLPETPAVVEYHLSGRQDAVYRWEGRLLGYDGIGLDPQSRTVPVRVMVDEPRRYADAGDGKPAKMGPPALVRGMYVTVRLKIDPTVPLVVIPARALKPGNRVWQFLPDESVLDSPDGNAQGDSLRETGSASDRSPSNPNESGLFEEIESLTEGALSDEADSVTDSLEKKLKQAFHPDAWVPGRVLVRDQVLPVESLTLEGEPDRSGTASDTGSFQDARRLWVCEVSDGSLQSGSLVVVSPLGSVQNTKAASEGAPATEQRDRGVLARAPAETVHGGRSAVHTALPAAFYLEQPATVAFAQELDR